MAEDAVSAWLEAAGRYPVPGKAEQLHLARLIQQGQQPDATPGQRRAGSRARDKLIQGNLRLIVPIARKMFPRCRGTQIEMCDLLQSGVQGLVIAVERFDPERGYSLSTPAYWWISQSIRRYIHEHKSAVRVPLTVQDIERRWMYRPALADGGLQSLEEFCEEWGIQPSKVKAELAHYQMVQCCSLDSKVASTDGASELGDLVADKAEYNIEDLDYSEAVAALREVNGDTVALLELQLNGASRTELGELMDVKPNQVKDRLSHARRKLREAAPAHVAALVSGEAIPLPPRPALQVVSQVQPARLLKVVPTIKTAAMTQSRNGHEIDKLERLVAEVQQAEPQAEPKPRRRRRTRQEMAAARAAASGGTLTMRMAGAEIEGSPADLAVLLREMNRAS